MQVFLFWTKYAWFYKFPSFSIRLLLISKYMLIYLKLFSCPKLLSSASPPPTGAFILLNTEAYTTLLSLPGHFQRTRAYKTRTFTTIWKTWLSMYEASLCGPITSVDRTWLFHSVAEPALLIIHALLGSGHPHVLLTGLAPFRCYCQRKWMSNSTCFCWVLAHPHQGSGWVLLTMWLIDREE